MGRFGLTCHAGALTRLVSAQAGSRSTEARVETAGRNPKSNGQGLAVYFTGLIELFELAGQICKRWSLCLDFLNVVFGPQPIL